jgi:acid phosphatase
MKQTRRSFLEWLLGLFPVLTGFLGQFRARGATTSNIQIVSESSRSELAFLIFGDWGRGGEFHQHDVANQMGSAAAKLGCRFIVSVGDNFYENGVQSATDPQWKNSFEGVYTAPSLGVPWYAILGNHDYKGRPEAQLAYAKTHPHWKIPARYFSVVEAIDDKEKVEFFFIDTSPFVDEYRNEPDMRDEIISQDTSAQVRWLDQALSNSAAAWKIVIGHHPIFSGGTEHGDQPELIRGINPLLEKHRVPAYFNGHDHDLQHIVRGSVEYFNTGAGSKVREPGPTEGSRFYRGTPGFMAVTLTAKEMHVEVIDYTGASLYRTRVQNRAVVSEA